MAESADGARLMASHKNGYLPAHLFITLASGTDSDGYWEHQLTPTTYRKFMMLRARALARTGRMLELSSGWSGYRPIEPQRAYWARYGYGAAYPGTSSHGGVWEGQDTLAMDIGNWAWVYANFNNPREEFYKDARAAGLEPGLIHPSRGNNYPDEPWHVIDLDPWAVVPEETEPAAQGEDMYVQWSDDPAKAVYAVATEVGQPSMRVCGRGEAAIARASGRVVSCDRGTLELMSKEANYVIALGRTDAGAAIASAVWNGQVIKRAGGSTSVIQELANIGTATTRPKS